MECFLGIAVIFLNNSDVAGTVEYILYPAAARKAQELTAELRRSGCRMRGGHKSGGNDSMNVFKVATGLHPQYQINEENDTIFYKIAKNPVPVNGTGLYGIAYCLAVTRSEGLLLVPREKQGDRRSDPP